MERERLLCARGGSLAEEGEGGACIAHSPMHGSSCMQLPAAACPTPPLLCTAYAGKSDAAKAQAAKAAKAVKKGTFKRTRKPRYSVVFHAPKTLKQTRDPKYTRVRCATGGSSRRGGSGIGAQACNHMAAAGVTVAERVSPRLLRTLPMSPPQRRQRSEDGLLRRPQVPAYHRVGHEEDRGQQHPGEQRFVLCMGGTSGGGGAGSALLPLCACFDPSALYWLAQVFIVDLKATKKQIKAAVANLYDIQTKKVNTLIRPDGLKKAYVCLTADFDALDVANR
jgi:hypothetical protein